MIGWPARSRERLRLGDGQRRDAGQRGRHRDQNLGQRVVLDDPLQGSR